MTVAVQYLHTYTKSRIIYVNLNACRPDNFFSDFSIIVISLLITVSVEYGIREYLTCV